MARDPIFPSETQVPTQKTKLQIQQESREYAKNIFNSPGGSLKKMEQSPLDAAAGKIGDALLSPLESLGKAAGAFNPFSGDDLGKRAGMLGEGTLGLASAPFNAGKQFLGATGDVLRSNPVTSFAGEPINFAYNAINKGEGEIKSGLSRVGEGVVQAAQNYQWNPLENDPKKRLEYTRGLNKIVGGGTQALFSPVTATVGTAVESLPESYQKPIANIMEYPFKRADEIGTALGWDDDQKESFSNLFNLTTALGIPLAPKGIKGKFTAGLGKTGSVVGDAALSLVSKGTSLSKDTIKTIFKDAGTGFLSKAQKAGETSDSLALMLASKLDELQKDAGVVGKIYEPLKKLDYGFDAKPIIDDTLARLGIERTGGKLSLTKNSARYVTKEGLAKVEEIVNRFDGKLNVDQYLNLRGQLDDMANWQDKTHSLAKALRKDLNSAARKEISGLAELDAKFAERIAPIRKLEKEYFVRDLEGNLVLKDGAASKIRGSINSGRGEVLKRLKGYIPDIEDRVKAIAAMSDIDNSLKVGNYSQILKTSGIIGGTATIFSNPLLGAAMIGLSVATEPSAAAAIIKRLGKLANLARGGNKYAREGVDNLKQALANNKNIDQNDLPKKWRIYTNNFPKSLIEKDKAVPLLSERNPAPSVIQLGAPNQQYPEAVIPKGVENLPRLSGRYPESTIGEIDPLQINLIRNRKP